MVALLSAALPAGENDFCNIDGVWVARPQLAGVIALLLHAQLERVAMATVVSVGRNEKADILYDFLMGSEFQGEMEAIVRAFVSQQNTINAEKVAHEKHWRARETVKAAA